MKPLPRRHGAWIAVYLLLLVAAACGGGGGDGAIELGTLALVPSTDVVQPVTNPLGAAGTLELVADAAPFSIVPGFLPRPVGAGEVVDLPLRFAPDAPGTYTRALQLRFVGATASEDVELLVRARAEAVAFDLSTPALDFGTLATGEAVERSVTLVNRSALSTVTIQTIDLPSSSLSLVGGGLPAAVAPGGALALTVRYAPTSAGLADGTARIGPDDLGADIALPVIARSPGEGSEEVLALGRFAFDGTGRTESIPFGVPADAISFTIEATHESGGAYGLAELLGPDGRAYETLANTGPLRWNLGTPLFVTTVPNSDRAPLQLVPGGGTYSVRLWRVTGDEDDVDVRIVVERREPGGDQLGALPLNVFLAPGITVNAASAPTNARMLTFLDQIRSTLAAKAIVLGDVDWYDLGDAAYTDVQTDAEFRAMLRATGAASENRLNLCFVQRISMGAPPGQTIAGVAGAIGGPRRKGVGTGGVMCIFVGASAEVLGLVAAHEICHYLGLYHTVEASGTHDIIDDTLDCPANGTNGTCTQEGNLYLMHWFATGGARLSDGQGFVLRRHPCIDPGIPGLSKPGSVLRPPALDAAGYMEALGLGPRWCGTCDPAPVAGGLDVTGP
ncbi:MAG: choice-of-anchor D domain-containing protein [Planctomycetota bacterium]